MAGQTAQYSDHTTFNDPFDCDVQIEDDGLPLGDLLSLRGEMLVMEMDGGVTLHFDEYSWWEAQAMGEGPEARAALLEAVRSMVRKAMRKFGVLCLSQNCSSTLMWSHYADKHRGVCLEYDLTSRTTASRSACKEVDYFKESAVTAAVLHRAFCLKDQTAWDEVMEAYFFRKSDDWKYEGEWRIVRDSQGWDCPPGVLSGVYFGLDCPLEVRVSIMSMLAAGGRPPKFYQMLPPKAAGKPSPATLDVSEINPEEEMTAFWREDEDPPYFFNDGFSKRFYEPPHAPGTA